MFVVFFANHPHFMFSLTSSGHFLSLGKLLQFVLSFANGVRHNIYLDSCYWMKKPFCDFLTTVCRAMLWLLILNNSL